jgi:hypothetical protein
MEVKRKKFFTALGHWDRETTKPGRLQPPVTVNMSQHASSKIKSRTRMNFLLGKKIIRRKKEPFFETGGKVSAKLAVKYQGTRCESGTVAPL